MSLPDDWGALRNLGRDFDPFNTKARRGKPMLYQRVYSQLCAMEALSVGRAHPPLNTRGERMLSWLRKRYAEPPFSPPTRVRT